MLTDQVNETENELAHEIFERLNPHHYLMEQAQVQFWDLNCLELPQIKKIIVEILGKGQSNISKVKKQVKQRSAVQKEEVFTVAFFKMQIENEPSNNNDYESAMENNESINQGNKEYQPYGGLLS